MKNDSSSPHFFERWQITHGSTFSGVGGFDVGAELSGIETLWNCEFDAWNRGLLKTRFPNAEQYADIREMRNPKEVDVISGGFPCQDISVAGKGKGIKGERSGLWAELWRITGEVRPSFLLIENSPMLAVRGLETVLCDLAKIGYDAEWQCLPAAYFGAPHERERIYIIAYPSEIGRDHSIFIDRKNAIQRNFKWDAPQNIKSRYGWERWVQQVDKDNDRKSTYGKFLRVDDGVPKGLDRSRIEAMGNAVLPIVAHYLFECVKTRFCEVRGEKKMGRTG